MEFLRYCQLNLLTEVRHVKRTGDFESFKIRKFSSIFNKSVRKFFYFLYKKMKRFILSLDYYM